MSAAGAAGQIQRLLQDTQKKLLLSQPSPALSAYDYFRQSLLREYKVQETSENSIKIDAIVRQAWDGLRPNERTPFEQHAAADRKRFDDEQAIFEDMQVQYSRLKELARTQGVELPPSIEDRQHERRQQQQQRQQQVASPRHRPQAAAQPSQALAAQPPAQRVAQLQRQLRDLQQQLQQQVAQAAAVAAQLPALLQPIYLEQQRQALQASFSRQRDALEAQLQEAYRQQALAALSAAALQAPPAPQQQAAWQARQGQQQQRQQQQAMTRTLPKQAPEHEQHLGAPLAAELPPGVPETIDIVCAGSHGTMWVLQQQVSCHCSDCEELPPEKRLFSCPQWELHVGSTSSKKWKASFKVRPGGAPGVPRDGNGIQVGRWLEMNNVNFSRPPTGRLPVDPSRHREVSAKPPLPEKTYTSERILRMQRQRELDRQQQQQEEEEEEGQQGRRSGAVARQRSGSLDDALAGRPMKSPPEEKKPAVQLGRRLPGGRNTRGSTHRWASGVAYRSLMAGHDGSRRPPEARTLGQHSGTSKPWNAVLEGNYQPLNVRYSGERCCVCDIDSDFDFDQMVTCDCCGIAVHQSCYGIMELPGPDEMWLCRACELREDGKPPPQCCVCPVAGGALKPTSMRGLWCHSACLQWIPELTVADVELQEPVEGVRAIPRERWDLLCSVCRQRMGAKIQCESCFTAYHPLCARVAGYHMEIRDGPEGPDGRVLYLSYCARHARPQPHLSGARLVSASEEQGDLPEEQGADALCNGQPYELPDCAPLPGCPAGAARAMPVDRWQRQQHGTGTGASSVAAFWIPGPKEVAEMPRKRQRAAGRSGLQPYPAAGGGGSGNSDDEDDQKAGGSKQPPDELARMGASGGGRGRAQWGNRGAPVRGRRRGGRVGRSWNADLPTEPVDLLPLPEGVSEQMTVWCNGHRAQLNVRTQTILYHGQTISVTRFEALSGREVAKKWKQSLYSVGPDGEPEQMMQDWLEEHDLDRRALEELARNAAQVAAWKELVAAQVGEVVANMVDAVEDGGESRALTGAADSATPGVAGASSAAPGTSSAQHQSLGADSDGENEQQSGMAVAQAAAGKAGKLPLNGKQLLGQRAAGPQPVEVEQEARDEPDGGQTEAQQQVNASAQRQQGGDAELAATKGADVRRGTAAACSPGGPASALGRSGSTRSLLGQKRAREEQGAGPAGSEASGGDGPSSSRPHLTSAGASGQNGRMRRTNSLASVDARVADAADPEADPSGTGAAGPTAETTAGADLARGQPGLGRPRAGRHPLCVDVVCGGMRAVFDARTTMVTLPDGRELSPIEYEKLSGRSASKKWKWSIRVDAGGGVPGPTLEDWLTQHGLEDAVAPRARPSMLASISHQQEQQGGQAGGDGASFRGTMHREGCQCIICKNARRSGRTWAGMQRSTSALSLDAGGAGSADTVPDAPGTTAVAAGKGCASSGKAGDQARPQQQQQQAEEQQGQQLEQSRGSSEQRMDDEEGGPRVRDGKRAYLRALPQLATAGATPLELHSVPLSRCWTPEDWAAHRLRQAARAAAHEAGDGGALRAADLPPLVAGGGVAAVDSLAPRVSLGPGVAEGRPASLKEKLDACNATEHARIAFGKSGVHGWGLFARLPMAQDSMVAEYRGVLVRSSVAGPREARYRAAGRDCYLFNLDGLHVLDATEAGAITRFTNHSCAPSLYTKILNVDGRQRLVFFARHDIAVGQELTYNYRFEPEEGEARLPCSCGAPSCSGFLN